MTELARAAGVDESTLPRNASYYVMPPSGNAVVQTNDLTTVTPHVGGAPHSSHSGSTMNNDGTMTFSGSELLDTIAFPPAIAGVDSEIPSGGFLSVQPANPRFIDGSRLGAFLSTFDQFCLEEVTYEFIAGSSFTTPGQLLLAYINDISDEILKETGLPLLRDAYCRDGSVLFSVTKNATLRLGRPLLKWFFTNTEQDTSLEMPGMIVLINQLDTVNTTSVPLGTLVMHYRVRVRAPAFSQGNFTTYTAQSASLSMTNAVIVANSNLYVTNANSNLSSNLLFPNAFYWGIIASVADPGGDSTWRNWLNPYDQNPYVPTTGSLLIWRVDSTGAVYFYPDWNSALTNSFDGANPCYYPASTVAAGGTKGFKLWNISGSDVWGHNA